ncbi:MAG: hypothetical protein HZB25_12875 [Candidatus Eisenbacteria bacterium]|nr:hypothetical protein [Candidatus Eisenbacteria bacterium]
MPEAGAKARDFRARVSVGAAGAAGVAAGAVRVDAGGVDCAEGPAGPLRVDFGEVESLERAELRVGLKLFDGTTVAFDHGGSLDDLWDTLRRAFLARVSDSLRFGPADPRHTFDARVALEGEGGFAATPARLSVTRLGLNYLAESGPCAQLPFGSLGEAAFDAPAYEVAVPVLAGPAAPRGAVLRIAKLAQRTDEFQALLREARRASLADTARCLSDLAPKLGAAQRVALANELTVGRMVSRERCEAVAPDAWRMLWDAAAGAGRAGYRDALEAASAGPAGMFLGLMPHGGSEPVAEGASEEPADASNGEAADSASWDASPPVSGGDSEPGEDSPYPVVYAAVVLPGASPAKDRLALEVLSERDHATYVYRTAPSPAGADRAAAGAWLAAAVSHTLLGLNFRKEPLYLPEEQLMQARERLYRAALRRLPGLRELRARLLGRAIHSGPAAWKKQLEGL